MKINSNGGARKYLCVLLALLATLFAIITGGRKHNNDTQVASLDATEDTEPKLVQNNGNGISANQAVSALVPAKESQVNPAIETTSVSHKGACACASCGGNSTVSAQQAASDPLKRVQIDKSFVADVMKADKGAEVTFSLPGGAEAKGRVDYSQVEYGEVVLAQGQLTAPQAGFFFFQKQSMDGAAGSMVGVVHFDNSDLAYTVVPGADNQPVLVEQSTDSVICRNYAQDAPPEDAVVLEEGPEDYAEDTNIPDYQNGVPRYESMPGATAVLYLDFDGQEGQVAGWSVVDALPSGLTPKQMRATWEHVSEDFAPFNINVTTDKAVYDAAPQNSRQRCLVSPSSPVGSGVAFVGSFNWTGDTPCWAGYRGSKVGYEVTAHEFGHTMGLSHDGRSEPSEDYFGGYGSGETGWAPIMGNSYYKNTTHWSKGEYTNANRTQDDLAIISGCNNVGYKTDDYGDSIGAAAALAVGADGSVALEGIISTTADVDVFSFTTTVAGPVKLQVDSGVQDANLDVKLELLDANGTVIASSNPVTDLDAILFEANLAAGTYYITIEGVGKGDPAWGGYSDYCSLGRYKLKGNIGNAVVPLVYWGLNEDTGTIAADASSNQNDGTLSGGASWTSAAKDGGGLVLDGSSGKLSTTMTQSNMGAFTVALWVKNGASGQGIYDSVFCNHAANTAKTFQIDLGSGFYYRGSVGASFGSAPVGTWVHLAVVSDGIDTTLYYNGVPVQTLPGVSDDLFGNLSLGVNRGLSAYFSGQVDEFYLFDQALTQQDLLVLSGISLNKAPTASNATFSVVENGAVNYSLGTVIGTDPNSGDTLTYTIISGNEQGYFTINSATGEITTTVSFDREAKSVYKMIVQVNDGNGLYNTAFVTVSILNQTGDDDDADGLPDDWEFDYFGSNATQDADDDSDGDGISNAAELTLGLNPNSGDTDGDGYADGYEMEKGHDPNDSSDSPTSLLAAYWSFNGTNSSGDAVSDVLAGVSGKLNYGAALSSDGQGRSGQSGDKALDLGDSKDGKSMQTTNVAFLQQAAADDQLTISFWQKLDQTGLAMSSFWAYSPSGGSDGRGIQAHTPWSNNTIYLDMGGTSAEYRTSCPQPSGINWTQWNHIAFVKNGGTAEIWVNGVKIDSETGKSALFTDFTKLVVGANGGAGNSIDGMLDDFAIYKTVLTSDQIGALASGADPLSITNNEAPVASDATISVDENAVAGASVGTVSASDPDVGDTLTYSITAGNAGGEFAINASTGEITTTTSLDYETVNQYALTVEVSDGELSDSATITVNVTNVNEAPVANGASGSVAESAVVGTSVATVSAADPDTGDTLTYAITAGNDGSFAINPSTGEITVAAGLNYEAVTTYNLTVNVTDSGSLSDSAVVSISITDVDESGLAGVQAWEEQVNAGTSYAVKRTEALAGNAVANVDLSALSGSATYEFIVDAENLGQQVVHLLDGSNYSYRFEQWNNSGVMGVTRYGVSDYKFTAQAGQSLASPYGAVHHVVYVVDSTNTLTSLYVDGVLVGTLNQALLINSAGTVLGFASMRDDSNPGVHAFAAYNGVLAASEIGAHFNAWAGAIAPVAYDGSGNIAENAAIGTSVGIATAIDANYGTTLSFSITAGNAGGEFSIDSATGEITSAAALDYETSSQHVLTIEVSDGSQSDTATFTVNVTDVNEAPLASGTSVSVAEDSIAGTSIAIVTGSDPDAGDTLTYAITGGNDGSFAINSSTGEITLATMVDYEVTETYALTVTVTDSGALSDTSTVNVTVTDVSFEDDDNDGLIDDWEIATFGSTTAQSGSDDYDGDGLSNAEEVAAGTDVFSTDSDGDGYSDGFESSQGTDPNDILDAPSTLLVYLWEFNGTENAGTSTVDTVGGVSASFVSGAALTSDGSGFSGQAGDRALDLGNSGDGKRAEATDMAALQLASQNDQLTISFWQKLDQTGAYMSSFWAYSPSSGDGYRGLQAHTPWSNGTIYFDMGNSTSSRRISCPTPSGTNWTQWNHIALVKDGGTARIYVNGVLADTETGKSTLVSDYTKLILGANGTGGNSIDGLLDDFAIFNTALTGSQISSLAAGADPVSIQ